MQAIDKVSVVQQAVEQLKTYISSNDLEVGQKLPTEKELCAQLAIGRGSLREALRILAATGYVSQQPGRGAFVMRTKDVSHDKDVINWFETHEVQMKDYLEVRTVFEPLATKLAISRCTDEDYKKLEGIHKCFKAAVEANDFDHILLEEGNFHETIIKLSGNELLINILATHDEFPLSKSFSAQCTSGCVKTPHADPSGFRSPRSRLWRSMHAQTRHIGHQESESLQKKLPQGYHSPINTGMTGGGYMLLQDKIAVVTGANRGLGKAVALRFAEEGAKVMLVGRNTEALQAVQKMIEAKGGAAEVFCADVTDPAAVDKMAAQIDQSHGRTDILVNNAGISIEQPLNDMSIETWKQIIDTNLNSVAVVIKAFLPIMIRRNSGNIVNVGSGAGLRGLPGSCAYSASKAGVICLSQALGDEVRRYGIRVNVICPGPIDTELFQLSERREYLLKNGGDVFSPESVANSILFLASEMSGGMNSQILTMRGINRW